VFPILDQRIQKQVLRILATELGDNLDGWELTAGGEYQRMQPAPGEDGLRSQSVFMDDSFGLHELP
ncbi:MAG: hypothetical protein GC204_02410, partial [Chloroflexi bacterium]|nr:hypothetical protein [Chloroflexota bacterium]